jgi:hypothetical protein
MTVATASAPVGSSLPGTAGSPGGNESCFTLSAFHWRNRNGNSQDSASAAEAVGGCEKAANARARAQPTPRFSWDWSSRGHHLLRVARESNVSDGQVTPDEAVERTTEA